MEGAVHRFVRLLRLFGVRISVSETLDAITAVGQPGVLADREVTRSALRGTLIKDRRDLETFERVFDAFFALRPVFEESEEHGHAHDDLSDTGDVEAFTLSDSPGDNPEQGHSHGKPDDIRDFFNPEDLAQQYNLHQEANKVDLAASTQEVVLSNQPGTLQEEAARLQLSTSRLHNPGMPGALSNKAGLELDTELSVAQEMALLGWLGEADDLDTAGDQEDPADLKRMREQLAPLLEALPESLRRHLQQLLDGAAEVELREYEAAQAETIDESERFTMELAIRRILHSLHGSPRPRRAVSTRGTVDGRRTMRASMRYDGIPFRPVTVAKVPDRPRLVVLVDASLSVRATARFTLHLVHSLQSLATSVRTFVFVDRVVEVTDLFADHRIDEALSLIMAGLPAGGLIDVDADSDYGTSFEEFLEEYGSALTRRSTLMVLGDGRGNGHDPGINAFEEMARRARHTIWLTPEPRFSWGLGRCDLPLYAEFCDRVQVVRGLTGLEDLSHTMAVAPR
ncbi:VWA domain-containing protein [Branchiibius sp. NY16-3462-2]|uniref:VWA domain-containing protein n=1 Tax=Branchiibius sp. NY16-3462-2 TaxID=1807500 RepID=UPI0007959A22|nr:VWA domain-containing protein [Branchiibius sp. NY16-3462-2]KYH46111.1 VWA domain-containing protein [Branchiibius sp. NY16-3462-2]